MVSHANMLIAGSPAWAGIDLSVLRALAAVSRFPRVGGDRPDVIPYAFDVRRVPPRGRG